MGVTIYKKTAECECGCNYGSCCGKKTAFVLKYNRSVDVGSLYIKEHAERSESKYEHIISMGDAELAALIEVLGSPEPIEDITDEERNLRL